MGRISGLDLEMERFVSYFLKFKRCRLYVYHQYYILHNTLEYYEEFYASLLVWTSMRLKMYETELHVATRNVFY